MVRRRELVLAGRWKYQIENPVDNERAWHRQQPMLLGYRCRGSLMKCAWVYLTQRRWICKLTGCRLSARCITADLIQTAVIHIETYLHFKLSRTLRIHPLSLSLSLSISLNFFFLPIPSKAPIFSCINERQLEQWQARVQGASFDSRQSPPEVNLENLTDELPARQSESNYHYWILWVNIGWTAEVVSLFREIRENLNWRLNEIKIVEFCKCILEH